MRSTGFVRSPALLLLALGLSILLHLLMLLFVSREPKDVVLPGQRTPLEVSIRMESASGDRKVLPLGGAAAAQVASDIVQEVETKEQVETQKHSERTTGQPVSKPVKSQLAPVEPSPERSLLMPTPVKRFRPEPITENLRAQDVHKAVSDEADSAAIEPSSEQQARFVAASYSQQSAVPYPKLARRRGQQGTVWLNVRVDAGGRVSDIQVLESSGFSRLDQAARNTVRLWRFIPARRDGQAEVSYVKIPVKFQLDTP